MSPSDIGDFGQRGGQREVIDEFSCQARIVGAGGAALLRSGREKTAILDQFVAATGYDRKYAIRLLRQPTPVVTSNIKRPRQRRYGREVQDALIVAWTPA